MVTAVDKAPPAAAAPPAVAVAIATTPGIVAIEELNDYMMKHGASLYCMRMKQSHLGPPSA